MNNFVPDYFTFDADKLEGTFTRLPERSELPAEINETFIVEFYSRNINLSPQSILAEGFFLFSIIIISINPLDRFPI